MLFARTIGASQKEGVDIGILKNALELLARREPLPSSMRDHSLVGRYTGFRECHLTPDWLLIYQIRESELVLVATRTGSHSDLF